MPLGAAGLNHQLLPPYRPRSHLPERGLGYDVAVAVAWACTAGATHFHLRAAPVAEQLMRFSVGPTIRTSFQCHRRPSPSDVLGSSVSYPSLATILPAHYLPGIGHDCTPDILGRQHRGHGIAVGHRNCKHSLPAFAQSAEEQLTDLAPASPLATTCNSVRTRRPVQAETDVAAPPPRRSPAKNAVKPTGIGWAVTPESSCDR